MAQLPWRHHIALPENVDGADLRLWYAKAAIGQGWSRNVLVHHIGRRFHQRAGRVITNFTRNIPDDRTTAMPRWVTPHRSAWPRGRPLSPRACPPNSNPVFPQWKNSKLSWQTSRAPSRTKEATNDRIQ
ncbi:DUF1016 N-terminal domain-containing protein [Mycobacterium ostraviense]|uniref:DUF1016 N-terminal domain-containing protein n=1 Tax=Mycobacterium ostraviense TaxID=2738409 RepID=UPI001E3EC6D8|nr:DUF1016 N-terminal domain-containing protein [Mycobacterium ostraviense]UGT94391.1 DUF1016 N-terminal domain-containing protein [Mycobacterium ostraviense]